ncbi:hypothetical protein TNCV_4630241 [Trichonephila clavipes]|nr:hypothetical protein TNCV_4630241 [Trichonephila clavipes]
MDITPRKRTRIVTLSQCTSMTVRDISAAVGVGKSSVSRIINQQNNFGTVSPKQKSKCGRKLESMPNRVQDLILARGRRILYKIAIPYMWCGLSLAMQMPRPVVQVLLQSPHPLRASQRKSPRPEEIPSHIWQLIPDPISSWVPVWRKSLDFGVTHRVHSVRGSLVIKVSDRGWHVTSSSPVPLKTRRVREPCSLNLLRARGSINVALHFSAARGLFSTDLIILNHGQVTRTTPELAPHPNYHTNGRTFFELSTDLMSIAPLHVGSYRIITSDKPYPQTMCAASETPHWYRKNEYCLKYQQEVNHIIDDFIKKQSPNLEMGSGISRQMRDGISKREIVSPDDPDQDNGTTLLSSIISLYYRRPWTRTEHQLRSAIRLSALSARGHRWTTVSQLASELDVVSGRITRQSTAVLQRLAFTPYVQSCEYL